MEPREESTELGAPQRPSWHWLLLSAALHATLWLPLVVLMLPLGAMGVMGSCAMAGVIAGYLVARFAPVHPVRLSVLGSSIAATLFWAWAAASGALRPWPVALGAWLGANAIWALAAAAGGKVGQWSRNRRQKQD